MKNKTNNLVVKDNALINASYNLEVAEQRLILLAILEARKNNTNISEIQTIKIHADVYAKTFNVTLSGAYKVMKEAVNNLFNRQFSYVIEYDGTGKKAVKKSRWVSDILYVDMLAILEITFAPDVVPLITHLEEHFTSYSLKQVVSLNSKYSIRLYELLIAWRSTGKTPVIEIEDFRQKLGLSDTEYTLMGNLKNRVLEPSIKQINEHTDIKISYEQHKQGRNIIGFSFKLTEKNKSTKDKKSDKSLTDSQRHFFASKLSKMPEMSKYSEGTESYDQFAIRIADMLTEPKKLKELFPLLEKAGLLT